MKSAYFFSLLLIVAFLSALTALTLGAYPLSLTDISHALFSEQNSLASKIIFDLRLPRAGNAFIAGGLLGLAGVLMQVLLRNPLADPYILGISGGAAVATLLCLLLGVMGWWQNVFAFSGALLSMLLVIVLARNTRSWSSTRLLLTGVVVAAGWSALISFILIIAPAAQLHGMLFWLLGDLNHSQFSLLALSVLMLGLIISLYFARDLNLLLRGELVAKSLGVNVERLQIIIFIVSSLLTSSAVLLAGTIGFIGLIVPHMIRLLRHTDHHLLLPGSVLLGGSLLCLADTLARSIFSLQQLPVGVITALIGVPIFLIILKKEIVL